MERYGRCNKCNCCQFDVVSEPKICECGHHRCFHFPVRLTTTLLDEAYGEMSASNNKSISEIVGPVFKAEVNDHLEQNLNICLPKCRISDIRVREVEVEGDNDNLLEIDSFGYIFEDDLLSGKELRTSGIFLVTPPKCGQQKPTNVKHMRSGSSGATERRLEKHAEKYIIGESYSGQSKYTVREKVHSLEDRVGKMVSSRYRSNHAKSIEDISSVVGAVLLSFSSGSKTRFEAKSHFSNLVYQEMSQTATPLLWRIAQARRFFMLVLSRSENPQSTFFRAIAASNESMLLRQEEILVRQEEMLLQLAEMQVQLAEMQMQLTKMGETMETICRGLKALGVLDQDPDSVSVTTPAIATAVTSGRKATAPRRQKKKKRRSKSFHPGTPCKHGSSCQFLKMGRCKFFHTSEEKVAAATAQE